MKYSLKNSLTRKIDENLQITDLLSDKEFSFDCVVAVLSGPHPLVLNKVSDRAYYFLEGSATVTVGGSVYDVEAEDLVKIPAGTPHGLKGKTKYLVITSPPFDPNNESLV